MGEIFVGLNRGWKWRDNLTNLRVGVRKCWVMEGHLNLEVGGIPTETGGIGTVDI